MLTGDKDARIDGRSLSADTEEDGGRNRGTTVHGSHEERVVEKVSLWVRRIELKN